MDSFFKLAILSIFCSISVSQSLTEVSIGTDCRADIVESIPIGLTFNSSIASNSTFDVWMSLISSARQSIDIASLYWTLLGTDVMPDPDDSSIKGKQLLDAIIKSKSASVKIRIAVNDDSDSENSTDLRLLENVAEIRRVNFTRLVGAGVLHTKLVVVDRTHFYLGSANMDWRSLTQVKEMGVALTHCPTLAEDLLKIFEIYWYLGRPNAEVPKHWPKELSTEFNRTNPMNVSLNNLQYNVFLSSSPKSFCSSGRTEDIEAILTIIRSATKFIDIAVMDYFPIFLYSNGHHFWPVIDDALREAAVERKVNVRLMASHWNHTRPSMTAFLRSLSAFNDSKLFGADIKVKLFSVPMSRSQAKIPFARVNHNKYMVTDKTAYIGTSNWSADYFVNTGGVGIAITPAHNGSGLRDKLKAVFDRDWDSIYAKPV